MRDLKKIVNVFLILRKFKWLLTAGHCNFPVGEISAYLGFHDNTRFTTGSSFLKATRYIRVFFDSL